jgi:anti-sigma regulatory factor (Ser/Thr protein kinase)
MVEEVAVEAGNLYPHILRILVVPPPPNCPAASAESGTSPEMPTTAASSSTDGLGFVFIDEMMDVFRIKLLRSC